MKYKFNIFSIIFGLIALACFGGVIRLSSPFDPLNLAIGFTGAIFSIAMIALNVCVFILELVENINLDHGPR